MTEIQNSKHVWGIGYWNLEFICNLVLGIWNLPWVKQGIEIRMKEKGGLKVCLSLETF